jgi:hypothetical protein
VFAKAKEEEQRQIKKTDKAKEPNLWLQRVKYIGYLTKVNQKQVRTFIAFINPKKELRLAILDIIFK